MLGRQRVSSHSPWTPHCCLVAVPPSRASALFLKRRPAPSIHHPRLSSLTLEHCVLPVPLPPWGSLYHPVLMAAAITTFKINHLTWSDLNAMGKKKGRLECTTGGDAARLLREMYSQHLEVIYNQGRLHQYQIILFLLRGQGLWFCACVLVSQQIYFATSFLSLTFSFLRISSFFLLSQPISGAFKKKKTGPELFALNAKNQTSSASAPEWSHGNDRSWNAGQRQRLYTQFRIWRQPAPHPGLRRKCLVSALRSQ